MIAALIAANTVLSATVGVPLAILAMLLVFAVDARNARRVRVSLPIVAAAAITTLAVLVLVVARFVEFA